MTLHVSTTTMERAFSAMKIVKIRLRNKIGNDFLTDSLVIYIHYKKKGFGRHRSMSPNLNFMSPKVRATNLISDMTSVALSTQHIFGCHTADSDAHALLLATLMYVAHN